MRNRWIKPLILAGLCTCASAAIAENRDNAWSLSALGGLYSFDTERGVDFANGSDLDSAPVGSLALGYNFTPAFTTEFVISMFSTESDNGAVDIDGQQYRLDGLYHLNPRAKFTPYFVGGLAHQILETNAGDADEFLLNAGLGAKIFLSELLALRADARIIRSQDYDYTESLYTIGLSYALGGTPAKPADADNDGVADKSDSCPGTEAGLQVDAAGCTLDGDSDGVPNQNDSCPNSMPGEAVDAKGCAVDSDKDGISNADDKCPNTPAGAKIDAKGCPLDTDKDGIPDYADKCADTPIGAKITDTGCRVKLKEAVEMTMKIEFQSGKNVLLPAHFPEIKRVADFMVQYPDSEVVIEGHSDSAGARSFNLNLSQKRADAVRNRLVAFHSISADRITAVGYGPDRPVADNRTKEGRQQNRRVITVVKAVVEK